MTFQSRLKAAKAASGLTIVEMAIWFDAMSDQTMWTWLNGRVPKSYHYDQALRLLGFLEKELERKKPRLPLSMEIRQGDRHSNVAAIRAKHT